jgi:hypothetical protein
MTQTNYGPDHFKVASKFAGMPVEDLAEGLTLESCHPRDDLAAFRAAGLTDDEIWNLSTEQKQEILARSNPAEEAPESKPAPDPVAEEPEETLEPAPNPPDPVLSEMRARFAASEAPGPYERIRTTGSPFQVTGGTLSTDVCKQCGKTTGIRYLIRDIRKGVASHVLHYDVCAPAFFGTDSPAAPAPEQTHPPATDRPNSLAAGETQEVPEPVAEEPATDRPTFPEPDRDQLEIFVDAVFRRCSPDGVVSLRSFYQRDTGKAFHIEPVLLKHGLKNLVKKAVIEARNAAKVSTPVGFTPPVCTLKAEAGWQARQEDLLEGPTFAAELDENPRAALAKLESILGPATLVVRSGGQWLNPETGELEDKLHAYWRLKKPARGDVELTKLKELRRLATTLVGADPSNIPIVHPIRWPGSWHRKGAPRLCEIVTTEHLDNEIDLDDALAKLKAVTPQSHEELSFTQESDSSNGGEEFKVASDFAGMPVEDLSEGIGGPPTAEPARIAAALVVIPNSKRLLVLRGIKIDGSEDDPLHWKYWNSMGMAIWRGTKGAPEGFAAFDAWSKKSPKYNAQTTAERWAAYAKYPPTKTGAATIFYLADQASPGWREEYEAHENNDEGETQQQSENPKNNADETGIPPDTLAAIKDPSKDGRNKRFFNILIVLKARGLTVDSSVALFELYPKGIAAHYSGRLRHAVGEIWAKLETGGNIPNWLNTQTNEARASLPAILSQKDFLADFVPPDYILDGILQRRFIYSFTAVTGHGKTAIALLLAQAIGSANPSATFGIRHAAEKGRVIYFVGENPDDVRCRVIGANSKRDDDPELDRIHYIPGVFDIAGLHKELIAAVDKLGGVDFIIIDTSAAYFLGDDEISNTQMGEHARTLRSLTTLPGGPCVLVLCHPVKHVTEPSQLLPRGGGAFVAEMDGNLTGWKHDETLITLHHSADKWRGPGFEPITFKLEKILTTKLVDSKGRVLPTVHAVAVSEQEQEEQEATTEREEDELLAALGSTKEHSIADLARACNWMLANGEPHKSKVDRVLRRLLDTKLAKRVRGRRYRLTPDGKNFLEQEERDDDEVVEDRSGAVGSKKPFHPLRGMKQRPTVPCAYCSQTGDVYKFADGRLPKGERHHADLHADCAEPYFTGQQKPADPRLEILGPEPDEPCQQCGSKNGAVYLIRYNFAGNTAAHALHEKCAPPFFKLK